MAFKYDWIVRLAIKLETPSQILENESPTHQTHLLCKAMYGWAILAKSQSIHAQV